MTDTAGYDRMRRGERYANPDWDLIAIQSEAQARLAVFNATPRSDMPKRRALLGEMLGHYGDNGMVFSPLTFEYGKHIFLERGVFINFGCTFLDGADVRIGEETIVAPYVQFITAAHAPHHRDRVATDENGVRIGRWGFNKPITVGKRCWIGASAILLPGVTIGDDTVIGAGSVVTRPIPAGVIAAGNPCRVIKPNP